MKQLAYWAHSNKTWGRMAVVACHIALASLSYFIAYELALLDVQLPASLAFLSSTIFILTILIYPTYRHHRHVAFLKRKAFHFVVALCSFSAMLFMFSNLCFDNAGTYRMNAVQASVEPAGKSKATEILESLKTRDRSSLTRQEKRILRKEFRHQLKVFSSAMLRNDQSDWENAGLILLAIISALGIAFLLAALMCGISCGGMEAVAVLLILAGTAGLVFALVAIIRELSRRKKISRAATG